jgi:hypothetical protein
MELFYNNNTFFFDIQSDDLVNTTSANQIINKDVISLSINEEAGMMTTGSLTLRDNDGIYSKIFRCGFTFTLSWGYKKIPVIPFLGKIVKYYRKGLQCVIQTPNGTGGEDGAVTYTVTFYSLDVKNRKNYVTFDGDNIGDVVSNLMDGLNVAEKFIDDYFKQCPVTKENPLHQRDSDFGLLVELAQKWAAQFFLTQKDNGTKAAFFVRHENLWKYQPAYLKSIGLIDLKELYYKSGDKSNVRSFTWQQHIGENGAGDGVTIKQGLNGQPIIEHRVIENQKVKVYRLNPDKIKTKYAGKSNEEIITLVGNYVNAKDFDQVKWAFDSVDEVTAPQGQGFTVTVEMIGDPNLLPGMQIIFKNGFPVPLSQSQSEDTPIKFYIHRVTSNISASGYFISLEIVDNITENGGYLVNTVEAGIS